MLCAIWMTGFYDNPIPQMVLLLITHIAYILFLLIIRPYMFFINTFMTIICTCIWMCIESYFLYIYFNSGLTAT